MLRTIGTMADAAPPIPAPSTDAGHLGLALRYRPSTFATLTGQRHVAAVLGKGIVKGTVPQQLLFSGGSGLGKTTVARICAAALLCETPVEDRLTAPGGGADACGHCASCVDVTSPKATHPDVIEFDAASHGGKDDIREIAARASTAPMRGRRKIYIIDEAHGLSGPGGQAFLKLLEEPPAHVVFMLATTDPQKMLKTNRGRCTEFELLRPSDDELIENLRRVATGEGWVLSDVAAAAVVAATDPALGVRGTLMNLEKLAPRLAWGAELDDDELATLLGVAPATVVSAVWDAVAASDRPGAFDALGVLRRRVPDDLARKALLNRAREDFLAAVAGTGPVAVELAQHRYEALASAPGGDAWTDLVLARLASPQLDPTPDALAAQLAEAERVIATLTAAGAEARSRPTAAATSAPGDVARSATPASTVAPAEETAAPRPGKSSRTRKATTPAGHETDAAKPDRAKPDQASSNAPTAAPSPPEPSAAGQGPGDGGATDADAFRGALAGNRKLVAMVAAASVTADGTSIVISAAPGLLAKLRSVEADLAAAATSAGAAALVLTEAS